MLLGYLIFDSMHLSALLSSLKFRHLSVRIEQLVLIWTLALYIYVSFYFYSVVHDAEMQSHKHKNSTVITTVNYAMTSWKVLLISEKNISFFLSFVFLWEYEVSKVALLLIYSRLNYVSVYKRLQVSAVTI